MKVGVRRRRQYVALPTNPPCQLALLAFLTYGLGELMGDSMPFSYPLVVSRISNTLA